MFAGTLMFVLLAHELGHYWVARRLGMPQSLPYFIPAPTLLGTLGAVILLRQEPRDRAVLLKVAVAGPLFGLVPALAATIWGLQHSTAVLWLSPHAPPPFLLGQSALFAGLRTLFGPEGHGLVLHPVAYAGWVGLFITSLNLIPAAQLDGGHIAYALFGRRQLWVSLGVVLLLLALGLWTRAGGLVWLVWAVMLFVIGLRHPPVQDELMSLTPRQKALGVAMLLLFGLTFVPRPLATTMLATDQSALDHPPGETFVAPPADPMPELAWPPEEFRL
jgi:membrane-associated protease RseP (regulator of RpoE activity)